MQKEKLDSDKNEYEIGWTRILFGFNCIFLICFIIAGIYYLLEKSFIIGLFCWITGVYSFAIVSVFIGMCEDINENKIYNKELVQNANKIVELLEKQNSKN